MLKGWQGASNPFIIPMEKSVENAGNIVSYHLSRLFAHKDDGAWQLAMYNDFEASATPFITKTGEQAGDKEAQTILTKDFESEFKDMATKLDDFDSLVRVVYPVNSTKYNLIMGRTRNRFYDGSYEQRLAALAGLSKEMNDQAVPDGVTAVNEYITEIKTAHTAQTNRMAKVGDDSLSIDTLRNTLIKKLNKDRGGLIFNFGDDDDCQEKVNKYFPLNLLGDRSQKGHYQLLIPKVSFRKICIHTFKEGELVDLEIGDADVWISTADNADNGIASGYNGIAGTTVRVNPTVFGDLTKKYLIATNTDLSFSTDLVFNIRKAVTV